MKIPNSVRIGGVEYPVCYECGLNDGEHILYGEIDYENCAITLSGDRGTSHDHRCITLWHEILHGIRNHAGIVIENEEKVVDMFARGIHQVLQDNCDRLFGDQRSCEDDLK